MSDDPNYEVPHVIPRDRWDRPLVTPIGGGKAVAYNRASSYADVLDDKTNLTKWKQRLTAVGITERLELRLAIAATRPDNKSELDKICEQALDYAGGNAKASIGTSLHAITEAYDLGQDIGFVPEEFRADIDAYQYVVSEFKMVVIERFVVNDARRIAGTPDRIVGYGDDNYVWDLKTGSVDFSWLKISAQLATYAEGKLYNPETGERKDYPVPVNQEKGIVLHLPSGEGRPTLYWVDLGRGREALDLSAKVREIRKVKQIASKFV